jgi:hypothetical protein
MKSLTALMALTAIEWTRMIGKMAVEEEVSTVTALLATEDEDVAAAETGRGDRDRGRGYRWSVTPFQLNTCTNQSPSTDNDK